MEIAAKPAAPASNVAAAPPCPECGAPTLLKLVVPDIPYYEKRTFECQTCRNFATKVVRKS